MLLIYFTDVSGSIDVIVVSPVCKLRKIFTMRNRLAQSVADAKSDEEWLPPEHTFAAGIEASIQVIDMEMLQNLVGTTPNLEGRREIASARVINARKIHPNKIERHVHVAFGSRMPLPLSTVQINTNLPHDANLGLGNTEKVQSLTYSGETCLKSCEFKGSETIHCPPRIALSATEREIEMKKLDEKAIHCTEPLWSSVNFPVQEESPVENVETDPFNVEKYPDLLSKQGQKLLRLNRRKEDRNLKRYHQTVRHSQKDSPLESKCKETKEPILKESPPGSPPSGWEYNSNEGTDNFPFNQHFHEGLQLLDTNSTPAFDQNVCPSFETFDEHKEADYVISGNGCISEFEGSFYEAGNGMCYFDKQGLYRTSLQNEKQDWPLDMNALGKPQFHEKGTLDDLQTASIFEQDLGEAESCASSSLDRPPVDITNEVSWLPDRQQYEIPRKDSEKPCESHVISKNLKGNKLEHSGPFGSTEELWIVHEENDLGEYSASTIGTSIEQEVHHNPTGTNLTKSIAATTDKSRPSPLNRLSKFLKNG